MNPQEIKDLVIKDLQVGTGKEAKNGNTVTVNYVGKFVNGKVFDSSEDPFSFKVGSGSVINGWEMGIKGMKVGGKRELYIPAHLAYGDRGAGGVIPPKTPWSKSLFFLVEIRNLNQ